MKRLREIRRSILTLAVVSLFGLGGLGLAPFLLFVPRRIAHALVRGSWIFFVFLLDILRLIHVDRRNLPNIRGCVLVSNHPSLLDVVFYGAIIPRTLFVAKHSLRRNPFCAGPVRALSLPDEARLVQTAAPLLKKGWNILIFPEGTRSPGLDRLHPFKRGAAQVALFAQAPLICLAEHLSFRILGKDQPITSVGDEMTHYSFSHLGTLNATVKAGESVHTAAVRLTKTCENMINDAVKSPSQAF